MKRSTLLRLETQLDALDSILNGATPEALARRPPSGAWSAHEHVAHLARHHAIFLDRLRQVAAEEAPHLARYRAEDDPEWPAMAALPTDVAVVRMRALRANIVQWISGLSAVQTMRVGIHPLFGAQSVADMVEFFLVHEGHHLYMAMTRLGDKNA
jgi:uncharacterized damage-inducible protein DinB